jgi:hypothetical protein
MIRATSERCALTTRRRFHTFHWQLYPDLSGRNSVVECQLPKLDVAGSTPVARSKIPRKPIPAQK